MILFADLIIQLFRYLRFEGGELLDKIAEFLPYPLGGGGFRSPGELACPPFLQA